jgi:hypothetical protein
VGENLFEKLNGELQESGIIFLAGTEAQLSKEAAEVRGTALRGHRGSGFERRVESSVGERNSSLLQRQDDERAYGKVPVWVELGWEEGEMGVLLWEEERKSNTSLRLD